MRRQTAVAALREELGCPSKVLLHALAVSVANPEVGTPGSLALAARVLKELHSVAILDSVVALQVHGTEV